MLSCKHVLLLFQHRMWRFTSSRTRRVIMLYCKRVYLLLQHRMWRFTSSRTRRVWRSRRPRPRGELSTPCTSSSSSSPSPTMAEYCRWGRTQFIQRRTWHILFTVIWRQTYGKGNPLLPHRLLFPISKGFFYMHLPTDRITHTTAFDTPVVEHWLEQEIAQWVR